MSTNNGVSKKCSKTRVWTVQDARETENTKPELQMALKVAKKSAPTALRPLGSFEVAEDHSSQISVRKKSSESSNEAQSSTPCARSPETYVYQVMENRQSKGQLLQTKKTSVW
ncbi:uncharacterized protein PAC_15816 [Phialocephala subalpina]|uniref:Uncharacterized protein n=1 Tax=Phialocephala subalpina TaxID=576137 RepID=A0A1L7XLU2_9HELO|nr:uncharacterized protein PAC_15816 [Phialocephala subalpina]